MGRASIFKQALEPDRTRIEGYIGIRPISVGVDDAGTPSVWFEQHGTGGHCDVEVLTVGTGYEFDSWGWMFIGTFTMPADGHVFHSFWQARHR